MMAAPQFLIEGVVITSFAIGCNHAFIYLRGEVVHVYRRLLRAVEEAYAAGYLGKNIHGSGLRPRDHRARGRRRLHLRRGDRAARLASRAVAASRASSRRSRPSPASTPGRPSSTTSSRIASVPPILLHGADWFAGMGTEKSTGFGIFSLSGHVKRPGQYEAPLGITLRELLDMAGGMRDPQQEAEVLDPGRLVDAVVHRRAPRRAARLRVGAPRRGLDARHPRAADLRRDDLRGARDRPLDRLLRARVLRQVHAVPRGHLVAQADPRPARARRRAPRRTSRSCSTSATTSSAARSARSVTARPARSPAASSTSATSTSQHLTARAAARSTREPRRCSPQAEAVTGTAA